MIYKAPAGLSHRSSGLLILLFMSTPTVIFTCGELSSAACSSVAGYRESFTAYYSCHLLRLSVTPTLSFHHYARLPVSLFVYFSLFDKECITCQSLIFRFPLPFSTHLLPLFFVYPHSLLSSSPPLSMYFVWLTSVVIIFLPLVFCFVYVVSFGLLFCASQGKKIHIHVSVL